MFRNTYIFGRGDERNDGSNESLPESTTQDSTTQQLQAELDQDIDEINRGLKFMSFQKRLQIQEEVHGVADPCEQYEETPENISMALDTMQGHLDDIWYKPTFDRIPANSYIHTEEFRLRFLRCESYECKKAAERLVRYADYMNAEWGFEALERELRLSDLEKGKDKKGIKKALRSGLVQILPFRDRSGRMIQFAHPEACNWNAEFSKVHQYQFLLASGDEETQRKGLVGIMWTKGSSTPMLKRDELQKARAFWDAVPLRLAVIHQVANRTVMSELLKAANVLNLKGDMRLCMHLEDPMEVRYKLMSFGIPIELLPITDANNVKLKNHQQWLKGRIAIEKVEEQKRLKHDVTPHGMIGIPSSPDVVFKSGTANPCHPGNAHYRDMLEFYCCDVSIEGDAASKQSIVAKVMGEVQRKGGRFLEWSSDNSCWSAIGDPALIKIKVYSSLFYLLKQQSAKRNLQSSSCSTHLFVQQDAKRAKMQQGSKEKHGVQGCL